jgi:hypothetical protein
MRHRTLTSAAVVGTALITLAVPTAALAAPLPRHTMELTCDGLGPVEIVTSPAAHDTWSAAQLTSGGHLVPVAFRHLVYDDTAKVTLFDGTVTHAPAHDQQNVISCTATQQTVLDAIAPPDFVSPEGVALTDEVTVSFIATVVPQP